MPKSKNDNEEKVIEEIIEEKPKRGCLDENGEWIPTGSRKED